MKIHKEENASTKKGKKKKTAHGTQEWSDFSANFQTGCENGCLYCYARERITATKKVTSDMWMSPIIRQKDVDKNYRLRLKVDGSPQKCMFPTSHDVTENNIDESIPFVTKRLKEGTPVLIVSKPRLPCIKRLCDELEPYKSLVTFRFTIGSSDSEVLKFWEPGATSYAERLECLEYAFRQGYETSVSCEPMLDNNIEQVVADTRAFVTDAIWLGIVNRMGNCLAINLKHDPVLKAKALMKAKELSSLLSDERIHELYNLYHADPKIKWKESLKDILNLDRSTESGLDI